MIFILFSSTIEKWTDPVFENLSETKEVMGSNVYFKNNPILHCLWKFKFKKISIFSGCQVLDQKFSK